MLNCTTATGGRLAYPTQMPELSTDLERNAGSLDRLRALVEQLSAADLERSLGADWTVKTALGHLTYWDQRQRAALALHLETGTPLGTASTPPLEDSDDVSNVAITALANAGDGELMRAAVIEAAEGINALLETTDRGVLAAILDSPRAEIVQRWTHREEHVAQIEAGLSG